MAEFTATLKKYKELSRKTAVNIVNKKAFYIARDACRNTYRPPPGKIGKALSALVFTFKDTKKGARRKLVMKTTYGAQGQTLKAPLAALLINWKRGKLGLKGLNGEAMKAAIKNIVGARTSARAYLASGWIPAIKKFAPLVSSKSYAAPPDKEAQAIKNPKGVGHPAVSGDKVSAVIENSAVSKHSTTKDPLQKYGLPPLERAFENERKSMLGEIEKRMREAAQSCGIKTR